MAFAISQSDPAGCICTHCAEQDRGRVRAVRGAEGRDGAAIAVAVIQEDHHHVEENKRRRDGGLGVVVSGVEAHALRKGARRAAKVVVRLRVVLPRACDQPRRAALFFVFWKITIFFPGPVNTLEHA